MSKTIQLREPTYARLRVYKVGGLTFDDVVQRLMDDVHPETFHARYREWQRQLLERMEQSGDFDEL